LVIEKTTLRMAIYEKSITVDITSTDIYFLKSTTAKIFEIFRK
jgi:hypothetical protein